MSPANLSSKNRATLALMLLALAGCEGVGQSSDALNANTNSNSNGAAMEQTQNVPSNEPIDRRLVSAHTRFGFKLYSEIIKQSEGNNVFVSPASIALALSMAYNGAEAETRQAMGRALGYQGMSLAEANRANAQLKAALAGIDPKVEIQIANSLWGRKEVAFKPDFLQRNKEFYGAEISTLDFADPGAPSTINAWVSQNTRGKIGKIIQQIDRDSILFLINAIYFKGRWTEEFDKAKTKEDAFHLASGGQKRVPLMSQSGSYSYLETKGFQAVSLPYGERRVSAYIFLPSKESSLTEFHKALTDQNWEGWMSQFQKTQGEIAVPRFRIEYEVELGEALKALGMDVAFDPGRANFTGMLESAERAFIKRVKHKSFVEVNEEGTEAAASTSVEIGVTSVGRPRQSFRMVVDRPFFFAIRDNQTGAVLFMGSITDPS